MGDIDVVMLILQGMKTECSELTSRDFQGLKKKGEIHYFKNGQEIFSAGDWKGCQFLYILTSGTCQPNTY